MGPGRAQATKEGHEHRTQNAFFTFFLFFQTFHSGHVLLIYLGRTIYQLC